MAGGFFTSLKQGFVFVFTQRLLEILVEVIIMRMYESKELSERRKGESFSIKDLRDVRLDWDKLFKMTPAELDDYDDLNFAGPGDWVFLLRTAMNNKKNASDAWRILKCYQAELARLAKKGDIDGLAWQLFTTKEILSQVLNEDSHDESIQEAYERGFQNGYAVFMDMNEAAEYRFVIDSTIPVEVLYENAQRAVTNVLAVESCDYVSKVLGSDVGSKLSAYFKRLKSKAVKPLAVYACVELPVKKIPELSDLPVGKVSHSVLASIEDYRGSLYFVFKESVFENLVRDVENGLFKKIASYLSDKKFPQYSFSQNHKVDAQSVHTAFLPKTKVSCPACGIFVNKHHLLGESKQYGKVYLWVDGASYMAEADIRGTELRLKARTLSAVMKSLGSKISEVDQKKADDTNAKPVFQKPEKLYTFYGRSNGKFQNKDDVIAYVKESDKPCVYTYGFEYRHPTTHRVPLTKDEAIEKIKKNSFVDVTEEKDVIHINAYSDNDMF